TLYYRQDYLRNGRYPFLTNDEYVTHDNLRRIRANLIDRMNRLYYNPQVYGFPVPGQKGLTYDPFVTKAWIDTVAYTREHQYREVAVQNINGSTANRAQTFWDVLLKRADWI